VLIPDKALTGRKKNLREELKVEQSKVPQGKFEGVSERSFGIVL